MHVLTWAIMGWHFLTYWLEVHGHTLSSLFWLAHWAKSLIAVSMHNKPKIAHFSFKGDMAYNKFLEVCGSSVLQP